MALVSCWFAPLLSNCARCAFWVLACVICVCYLLVWVSGLWFEFGCLLWCLVAVTVVGGGFGG